MPDTPHLDALPYLATRPRQAVPKPRLRLAEKVDLQRAFEVAWERCKRRVNARDQWRCRVCGRHVRLTLTLCPERAEHHHVCRRSERALVTDARNVILVDPECHDKLTRHALEIVGPAAEMFAIDGQRYLNADGPLVFVASAPG